MRAGAVRARVAGVTPDEHADRAEQDLITGLGSGAAAVTHALLAIDGRIAGFGQLITLLAAPDHPPVPEQAATPEEAEAVERNQHWWVGWQPGLWPVNDATDPRGWRWGNPLTEG